jgi:hypothetical protein
MITKWPTNNPPTNFIQPKFCPNHWEIFSLKRNRPMLLQNGKIFPNLVTLTFDKRLTLVERVPTKRQAYDKFLT